MRETTEGVKMLRDILGLSISLPFVQCASFVSIPPSCLRLNAPWRPRGWYVAAIRCNTRVNVKTEKYIQLEAAKQTLTTSVSRSKASFVAEDCSLACAYKCMCICFVPRIPVCCVLQLSQFIAWISYKQYMRGQNCSYTQRH